MIEGRDLDLKELNNQYKIHLRDPDLSTTEYTCFVRVEGVTNTTLPCFLNKSENMPTEKELQILVCIS